MEKSRVYDLNKEYYDTPGVAEAYAKGTDLTKAEQFILSYLYEEIKDKAILDIGVGAGRTTPHLTSVSKNYTGIDYSETMLTLCKAKHRETHLLLCDVRKMDIFGKESFDVAYCVLDGLDDVDHEDRMRVLREIHRVLRNTGLFIFSAHNLEAKRRSPYDVRGLVRHHRFRFKRYGLGIMNHLKNKRHERHEEQYSIVNDQTNDFRLLTYYIKKEHQISQLEDVGFSCVEMVSLDGSFIDLNEPCEDHWIYYIARKR
jgi:ubiquinone/menaquinone biosynthesis C-methylase UbiE